MHDLLNRNVHNKSPGSLRVKQIAITIRAKRKNFTKGEFFWDYSVNSYSAKITEQTEYHSQNNRIADVTKIDVMLGTQFSRQKTARVPAILSIPNKPVYSVLLSGAELTEYYSVHSEIRIGPKRTQLPSIPCTLIPKRTCLNVV